MQHTPHSPFRGVNTDSPGLVKVVRDEHLSGAAVQASHFDAVHSGVCPVQVATNQVDGHTVRVVYLRVDQDFLTCETQTVILCCTSKIT